VARVVNELTLPVNGAAVRRVTSSSPVGMKQHERRLAAAAYDQALDAPRYPGDRTVFAGVPVLGRTILCDLTLSNDPPEALRAAIAETLGLLRVMWVALLRCDDGAERRQLEAVHAALQCELAATEWTWSGGAGDGHALARTLVRRREHHRAMLAAPSPFGVGLLLPRSARANEPLPEILAAAWATSSREAATAGATRAARLHEEAQEAVGAWRLGELEAVDAAAVLEAASGRAAATRSSPVLVAADLPPLRVAS
jgi:hypothetical protein